MWLVGWFVWNDWFLIVWFLDNCFVLFWLFCLGFLVYWVFLYLFLLLFWRVVGLLLMWFLVGWWFCWYLVVFFVCLVCCRCWCISFCVWWWFYRCWCWVWNWCWRNGGVYCLFGWLDGWDLIVNGYGCCRDEYGFVLRCYLLLADWIWYCWIFWIWNLIVVCCCVMVDVVFYWIGVLLWLVDLGCYWGRIWWFFVWCVVYGWYFSIC